MKHDREYYLADFAFWEFISQAPLMTAADREYFIARLDEYIETRKLPLSNTMRQFIEGTLKYLKG